MTLMSGTQPRVTIVMTARERHSRAEAAIEAIVAETPRPYRLIYLDIDSPAWLRRVFTSRAAEWGLEVVSMDGCLWPHQARVRIIESIATPYTVFIDNDVDVGPGWLEPLVACADATGAGIVGPLYLTGDGVQAARIHMAGGRLVRSHDPDGLVLDEAHVLANEDPRRVADQLRRQPCDFVEYHCMLIRTELLRAGVLDPRITCVHEHIDTSLTAGRLGYETYIEPAARVSYLGDSDYLLEDLPIFRSRWQRADADASIAAFCRKWGVVDDERSFGGVRRFLADHVADVDPIRPALRDHPDHRVAMAAHELGQTRSALLDLAQERGYVRDELALLANAYHLSHILMDGGYRPCGRPFINHLVGTASVLVRYGFRAETVAAGLLHSAYTHCPADAAGGQPVGEAVCAALGGRGSPLERRVRAYTLREQHAPGADAEPADLSTLSVLEAEIIAMTAANELDMYLSGEFRHSGRTDTIPQRACEQIAEVCELLAVDGLYAALRREQQRAASIPAEFITGRPFSYRIGQDKRTAVPMAGDVRAVLP